MRERVSIVAARASDVDRHVEFRVGDLFDPKHHLHLRPRATKADEKGSLALCDGLGTGQGMPRDVDRLVGVRDRPAGPDAEDTAAAQMSRVPRSGGDGDGP